jgi:hypothetical protein
MNLLRLSSAAACCALFASTGLANFTADVIPPFRGGPCSRFAGWEIFTSAFNGPNTPDVAGTTAPGATITQLVAGAILTSTGNIYHPSQASAFELADSAPADVQEVVLQTSTFGNSRSVTSFTLTYVNGQGQDVVLPPTEFVPLVQMPQQHDELYFRWDLSQVADVVLAYELHWSASAPNMSFDAALLDVRHACAPGVAYCFGDGTGTACPCANTGAPGNGCANSLNPAGANLAASGGASVANDTLVLQGSGMPNASCLYYQGNASLSAVFGDGLRCAGTGVIRLGTAINVGGASQYPSTGQVSISVRGNVSPADVRYYQAWYRNAASFCTSSAFNLSNGYQITWAP